MRDSSWHRLHPLSPLVRSGRGVLALLALAGFSTAGAIGSSAGLHWYDVAIPVAVAAAAVINWLVTRWKVDGSTLRIETGLLRRDSRQLPIARIQAVDLMRPFLARMLGLTELRVRLAGSSHADARLAYLTEHSATELRARLLAAHHGLDPATPEPSEYVLVTVPFWRLFGSMMLPALAMSLVAACLVFGLLLAHVSLAGLIAVVAPVLWWLVICVTLVWARVSAYYGFTVAISPDGVRIRRGLLSTVAETIPVPRVQAVRMIEPLLWRPLHWLRLEVDVAGHSARERQEGSRSRRTALLPVGTPDEARKLVRIAIGDGVPALTRPPGRARWRAPLSYHFLAAGHDNSVAVTVTGRLRKATTWVPLAKVQSVRFVQGPVQRGLRLATVHVDAAGRHAHAKFAERAVGEATRLVDELASLSRTARRQASPPVMAGQADSEVLAGQADSEVLAGQADSAGLPGQVGPAVVPPVERPPGQAASVGSPVNAAQSEE